MQSKKYLTISNLSFRYDSSIKWLFKNINLTFSPGWTGVIGPNGSGKTTLLKLVTGLIQPNEGSIHNNDHTSFCEQQMNKISDSIKGFMYACDSFAYKLKSRLDIEDDWVHRWDILSFGERKRMQIATAIWEQPLILAIDEPTNHLDNKSTEYLFVALEIFQGTGLLVTHNRHFLDCLCSRCVFIEPPSILLFKGGYSRSIEQKYANEEQARNELKIARSNYQKLKKDYVKRKHEASLADAKRSNRKIDKNDNDARARKRMAIITGKDGQAGKLQSQLKGRLDQYLEKLKKVNAGKIAELGIWIKGQSSRKDILLNLPAAKISFTSRFVMQYPELIINTNDKIALTGDNGSGKSTLIKVIKEKNKLQPDKLLYIPQEISIDDTRQIVLKSRKLSRDDLGKVMSLVKKLGSEPSRLLDTELPSPGELRKLILAIGITKAPEMIIMDEPTNHLDLPSVECLENALSECPCSLLLVSHDFYFLKKLTKIRWHISKNSSGSFALKKDFW